MKYDNKNQAEVTSIILILFILVSSFSVLFVWFNNYSENIRIENSHSSQILEKDIKILGINNNSENLYLIAKSPITTNVTKITLNNQECILTNKTIYSNKISQIPINCPEINNINNIEIFTKNSIIEKTISIFNSNKNIINHNEPTQITTNSVLFDGSDDYLTWTPTQEGNRRTWTYSIWLKPSKTTDGTIFSAGDNSNNEYIILSDGQGIRRPYAVLGNIAPGLMSSNYINDNSKFHNIIINVNTTQTIESQRIKMYIDGIETEYSTYINYPIQNIQTMINSINIEHLIGSRYGGGWKEEGYFSNIHFIDGQALTPDNFGKFNEYGQWIPKKYEGIYGQNGFHLTFSNSSNLGQDFSGNNNDWTVNGNPIQTKDNPENNFAVLNPLQLADAASVGKIVLSDGNLKVNDGSTSNYGFYYSTFALPTTGKYYWEYTLNTRYTMGGVLENPIYGTSSYTVNFLSGATFYEDRIYEENQQTGLSIPQIGDVVGVLYDAENKQVEFRVNNVQHGAIVNIENSSLPLFPVGGEWDSSHTTESEINFGQLPFVYLIPNEYKTLSSANLPKPNVIPSQGFDTILYNGTGTNRDITGLDFSPSLVWIKNRDQTDDHKLFDILQGPTKYMESNTIDIKTTDINSLTSFNSNGFSLGTGANGFNDNNEKFVAWTWKEGPEYGFDIINYQGSSNPQYINHELNKAPEMMIIKSNTNGGTNWVVYHKDLGESGALALQDIRDAWTGVSWPWNSTPPTSQKFSVQTNSNTNYQGWNYTGYLFTSIPGFSKIGSYTGNGNVDGPFVYTGFKPKYIMLKPSTRADHWRIYDTQREKINPNNNQLKPDMSGIEYDTTYDIDFLSNGFKIRTNHNGENNAGDTYIYIAFAEYPMSTNY